MKLRLNAIPFSMNTKNENIFESSRHIQLGKGETIIYKRKDGSDSVSVKSTDNSSNSQNIDLEEVKRQERRELYREYLVCGRRAKEGLSLAAVMKIPDNIDLRSVIRDSEDVRLEEVYVPKSSNGK